ncbi:hypothetical protein H9P43_001860 [Blastocladiella emersonii ATCC 22665]|nr:hypothetical protein H9P43_001860 [Blastocladiella emersonii ATCC 22665]
MPLQSRPALVSAPATAGVAPASTATAPSDALASLEAAVDAYLRLTRASASASPPPADADAVAQLLPSPRSPDHHHHPHRPHPSGLDADDSDDEGTRQRGLLALHRLVTDKPFRHTGDPRAVSLQSYFDTRFSLSRAQVYRMYDCALVLHDLAVAVASGTARAPLLHPLPTRLRVSKAIKDSATTPAARCALWAAVVAAYPGRHIHLITSTEVLRIAADLDRGRSNSAARPALLLGPRGARAGDRAADPAPVSPPLTMLPMPLAPLSGGRAGVSPTLPTRASVSVSVSAPASPLSAGGSPSPPGLHLARAARLKRKRLTIATTRARTATATATKSAFEFTIALPPPPAPVDFSPPASALAASSDRFRFSIQARSAPTPAHSLALALPTPPLSACSTAPRSFAIPPQLAHQQHHQHHHPHHRLPQLQLPPLRDVLAMLSEPVPLALTQPPRRQQGPAHAPCPYAWHPAAASPNATRFAREAAARV